MMVFKQEVPKWVKGDLARSGLTSDTFPVTPLKNEAELQHRLGFSKMGDVSILNVGGYWILYPSMPSFYRLKLKDKIGHVKYLSPKDAGNHAYIPPAVSEAVQWYKPDILVFIPEGEKKAAKATLEGFPCIGLAGVFGFADKESGFLPELDELNFKHRAVHIVYDSDIIRKTLVRQAELRLAVELMNRGAKVLALRLPSEPNGDKNGLDDYLVRYGKEALTELIKAAKGVFETQINEGTPTEMLLSEASSLASVLEREVVCKLIAQHEKVRLDAVREEAAKYAHKAEPEEAESKAEQFTEAEKAEALKLLKAPDILERMLSLIERAGYVGEQINKLLLYLAFTSRLFYEAISAIIKGGSASGKSALVKAILPLFPREAVMEFSVVTEKALLHLPSSLAHMILCVFERQGAESSDYSIRTALSEKELSILIPVKNPETGNFETIEKRIGAEGLCYVETTTRDRVHAENETRVFDIYVDETSEQTQKILLMEAEGLTTNMESVEKERRVWRCAQTLLKPYPVYIPYAKQLAQNFPTSKVRARRDFKRFLTLIKERYPAQPISEGVYRNKRD